jgi:hypothetical protein
VLDFIGDYGGFQQCIGMVISIFGTYFSAKFIAAGLARELYVERRAKSEAAPVKPEKEGEMSKLSKKSVRG